MLCFTSQVVGQLGLAPVGNNSGAWLLPAEDDEIAMLFATQPGGEALETREHGLFTASFVDLLAVGNVTWTQLVARVSQSTAKRSGTFSTHQVPYSFGALRDPFVFVAGAKN